MASHFTILFPFVSTLFEFIGSCSGLKSKWVRPAISAFSGLHSLHLSAISRPDYLPLSLQSTGSDCNHRWGDQIICNSTPSPFSARPSWC
jgi:hypothetical protein